VAVIGGQRAVSELTGWIVAEMDDTPDSPYVLATGVAEALLRGAALRILATWQTRLRMDAGSQAATNLDRLTRSLDFDLTGWRQRHPELDVDAVPVPGSFLDFLSDNASSIQLIVVGPSDDGRAGLLLGPTGYAALENTECSVLVCDRPNYLGPT
jgi:hypothetical protein